MKSTQDQHMWLNRFAQAMGASVASIEIFTNKSFRINTYDGSGEPKTVYDSDDYKDMEGLDINDLYYEDPEKFATQVKENLSIGDISASEL